MYMNGVRSLAWIARISEVQSIDGADRICKYRIGGWWVVDQVGRYSEGDQVVYVSIDAWVPTDIAPFLSKGKEPRVFNGVSGERLRSVKLRGTVSQGLLLPITTIDSNGGNGQPALDDGADVTDMLGIQKWERPIPAQLVGVTRGNFPGQIPKTDAERVQNLETELQKWIDDAVQFEVTVKLDGSSMTVANIDGEIHVCSRNLSLKLDQDGNSFVNAARKLDLISKLTELNRNVAIQGELIGPGIQTNQEKLAEHEFHVFEVYSIDRGCYLSSDERVLLCRELGLKHVPILHKSVTLRELGILSIDDALRFAEGPSLNPAVTREGVVFKNDDGLIKFKSISNRWLIKHDA